MSHDVFSSQHYLAISRKSDASLSASEHYAFIGAHDDSLTVGSDAYGCSISCRLNEANDDRGIGAL
jgi:hypothetical protein